MRSLKCANRGKKVWCARHGGLGRPRSLHGYDAFEAYVTVGVKAALARENTNFAVIPDGVTSVLQPLDVCLNKPFEDGVRKRRMPWMADGIHEFKPTNRRKKPSEIIFSWIAGAWSNIPETIIELSFLKCGVTNNLDGLQDELVYEQQAGLVDDESFLREPFNSEVQGVILPVHS